MDTSVAPTSGPMHEYDMLMARRAFQKGYASFMAGAECHAPADYNIFSGSWVEGWLAAANDNKQAPGAKEEITIEPEVSMAVMNVASIPELWGRPLN